MDSQYTVNEVLGHVRIFAIYGRNVCALVKVDTARGVKIVNYSHTFTQFGLSYYPVLGSCIKNAFLFNSRRMYLL